MKLIKPDYIILVAALLWYGVFFMTSFTIAEIQTFTELAVNIETNPVARQYVNLGFYSWVIQSFQVALMLAIYFVLRQRWWMSTNPHYNTDEHRMALYILAYVAALMFLQNFLNDLPIFLKIVVFGG